MIRNAGLEEIGNGIEIAEKKFNSFRNVDCTTSMFGRKEDLRTLLLKMK